jgi:murein endopeptidase
MHKRTENMSRIKNKRTVILATQEAEVRRIMVRSQHKQIVCETLSPTKKYPTQKGLVEW